MSARDTTYTYKFGAVYIGQWINGQPGGRGKLSCKEGIFEGQWKPTWRAGSGTWVNPASFTEKTVGT